MFWLPKIRLQQQEQGDRWLYKLNVSRETLVLQVVFMMHVTPMV